VIPNKISVESNLTGLETNKFSIQITDKSFRILLDGLYTDKHQSIIRELWTNALDSHKAAGKEDVPFECKLPNSLDPLFYVRDYGTGLSHEDVMHLYSTVFASTKTDTNEQIGCLGLGSKSPFSYTDSFTVISYNGNEKRTYIAALDEDGIPAITHLSTESSNEDTGLKVMFSSAAGVDNAYFSKAACRVSIGFNVKPNILGADIADIPKPIFKSETLEVYSRSEYITTHMIKMGPVLYPIPQSESSSLTAKFGWNNYAVVDVPVGSVEFAANREALQLTDDTRNIIKNVISDNIAIINETIDSDLKNADSYLNACKRYTYWSNLVSNRISNFAWKETGPIVSGIVLLNKKLVGNLRIQSFEKKLEYLNPKSDFGIYVYSLDKVKFIINNDEKIPRRMLRIREFCKQNSKVYFLNNPSNSDLKRLKRSLGISDDQFMSITELPDVEAKTSSGTSDPEALRGVTSISYANGHINFRKITHLEYMPEEDYLWYPLPSAKASVDIRFAKLRITAQFNDQYYGSLKDIIHSAKWLGWENDIVFFGPQAIKKFSDDLDHSMNLENYILEKIEDQKEIISIQVSSSEGKSLNVVDPSVYNLLNIPSPGVNVVPRAIRNYFIYNSNKLDVKDYSDIEEKYPMLFNNRIDEDSIKNYINLINNK